MTVQVEISGKMFAYNKAKFDRQRKEALRLASGAVINRARQLINNRTGRLAGSLTADIIGGKNARAIVHPGPKGFYGKFVEEGHDRVILVGYRRRWARGKKAGTSGLKPLTGSKSDWAAMTLKAGTVPAHPFLIPAAADSERAMVEIGRRVIVERVIELKDVKRG